MPGDVRERLLRDAVERGLELGRQASGDAGDGEPRRDPVAVAKRVELRLEGRDQPLKGENRRTEELRERAHLAERLRDQSARLGDAIACAFRARGQIALREPQVRADRGERLAELVVELARQPAALLLLRRHETA